MNDSEDADISQSKLSQPEYPLVSTTKLSFINEEDFGNVR